MRSRKMCHTWVTISRGNIGGQLLEKWEAHTGIQTENICCIPCRKDILCLRFINVGPFAYGSYPIVQLCEHVHVTWCTISIVLWSECMLSDHGFILCESIIYFDAVCLFKNTLHCFQDEVLWMHIPSPYLHLLPSLSYSPPAVIPPIPCYRSRAEGIIYRNREIHTDLVCGCQHYTMSTKHITTMQTTKLLHEQRIQILFKQHQHDFLWWYTHC